jgi:4-amino-4-deoxy-L-arabinose transferase-like glycosyltransferase
MGFVRTNVWFFVALALGLLVRVLVEIAYRLPFIQPDSNRYLQSAIHLRPDFNRTSGYSLILRLIPGWRDLSPIPLPQHVLGLVMGGLIYWMLVRRAVPRWAAALATVPVLLDPFELAIEHYILSDVYFEFFLVLAFALLTFRRKVGWRLALVAGFCIGLATITRSVGDVIIVVAVVALILGQARWLPAVALLVGTVVPVGGYMIWYHHDYGVYSTGRFPENLLYGRVANFVKCSDLSVPAYETPLCPKAPLGNRRHWYFYSWGVGDPFNFYTPPPGMTKRQVIRDFDRRAIKQEPLRYAKQTLGDALRGFAWDRHGKADTTGETEHWRFTTYGHEPIPGKPAPMPPESQAHINKPLARLLTDYSNVYIPGPFYGACLVIGLLAAVGVGRARRSGLQTSSGMYAVTAIGLLIVSTALSIFSWRYQLPQFVLLPPAAALGLTAMLRRQRPDGIRTVRGTLRELLPWKRQQPGVADQPR